MNLQKRTALVITIPLFLLAGILYFLFDTFLLHQFESIEYSRMLDNVKRVNGAMENTRQTLIAKTIDWGQWDDTYDFIENRNDKYLASVLNYETLAALQMRHVIYVNSKGKVVEAFKVLPEEEKTSAIPPEQLKSVLDCHTLFEHSSIDHQASGFLWMGDELVLVAAIPISDSKREKPINGTLVFTQLISKDFIDAVGEQTRLEVGATPLRGNSLSDSYDQAGLDIALSNSDHGVLAVNSQEISGFGLVRDLYSHPSMLLKTRQTRDIFQQGLKVRAFLLGFILIAILLAMFSMLLFLHRSVLARLALLTRELRVVSITQNTATRVPQLGADELGQLASDINGMLEALDRSKKDTETARQLAESANNAKSQFIAKVSHELRTPIHSIVGMLRIVMKQESNPTRRNHLGMARDAAYALLGTINDILDFSKAEAGMLSVSPVEFDPSQMLREALRTVAPRVYEREGVEFLCEIQGTLPEKLVGDPVRLKQILVNLLGNSAKFTNQGYVRILVHVGAIRNDLTSLRFEISDTGIGIAPDRLGSIFEPFTQADDSAVRRYQGTGLGLTIVKQLVEAMGGGIRVTSEPGRGSCFTVEIPFKAVGSTVAARSSTALRGRTVVVLDHSAERRASMQQFLIQCGVSEVRSHPSQDLPAEATLLATGEMLEQPQLWSYLKQFCSSHGATRVVTLHTPNQLTLRERLNELGVVQMLIRPALPGDIQDALCGKPPPVEVLEDNDALQAKSALRKLKVLIADDTPTNQIILTDMLEESGHEVTAVSNGQEMLNVLMPSISAGDKPPFDLILSDVQMPQLDGVSATRLIREKEGAHAGLHIPVIMVTAHAFPEEKSRILAAGADDVVTKPIEPKDLWRKIQALIG